MTPRVRRPDILYDPFVFARNSHPCMDAFPACRRARARVGRRCHVCFGAKVSLLRERARAQAAGVNGGCAREPAGVCVSRVQTCCDNAFVFARPTRLRAWRYTPYYLCHTPCVCVCACVYVCMYVYIDIYMHIYTYIYIYIDIDICIDMCMLYRWSERKTTPAPSRLNPQLSTSVPGPGGMTLDGDASDTIGI